MAQFGLNFKRFFDEYFQRHDEEFLANLSEVISEKDDSREIAALADWSFRNYLIEAVTVALELNNHKLYNDIMSILEGGLPSAMEREPGMPPMKEEIMRKAPEPYRAQGMRGASEMFGSPAMHGAPGIYGNTGIQGVQEQHACEDPGDQEEEWQETSSQPVDFNFEA